jgi:hypothetical protein
MDGAAELKDMLAHGWQVCGFTGDLEITGSMNDLYGQTNGHSILLQKHDDMAIAATRYDRATSETKLTVTYLTGKP